MGQAAERPIAIACRKAARVPQDRLETELKLIIGTTSGIDRVADWKTTLMHRFDTDRFKGEQPDLYHAFLAESRSHRFNLL